MGQLKLGSENSALISTNCDCYGRYRYDRLKTVREFSAIGYNVEKRLRKLLVKLADRIDAEGVFLFISDQTDVYLAGVGNSDFNVKVRQQDEPTLFSGKLVEENKLVQPIESEEYVIGYISAQVDGKSSSEFVEKLLLTYADFIFHELELAKREVALKKNSQRLEKKKEELKKTQEYNNILLSIASHDLSSPLNAVSGYLNLMDDCLEDDMKVERIESYHERIQYGVRNVMNMLDRLDDICRIEKGFVSLDMTRVNLGWVVDGTCKLLQSNALEKDIDLTVTTPDFPIYIEADTIKLKRVVQNLISNAIKYTETEGRVEVKVSRNENMALITVQDNGIGIPDSHYSKIFSPFVKLEESGKPSSSGLGLYIASYFTELMNGEINLESKENVGSVFTVSLPLLKDPFKSQKQRFGSKS